MREQLLPGRLPLALSDVAGSYRVLLSNYGDSAPSADWTLRPYESVLLIRESDGN